MSDVAISTVLNQGRHPVVFMSKMLQGGKLKYHIEEEAMAIVEAVQKWSYYLTCQHFTLIRDQWLSYFLMKNSSKNA